jgi:hypothetical protein
MLLLDRPTLPDLPSSTPFRLPSLVGLHPEPFRALHQSFFLRVVGSLPRSLPRLVTGFPSLANQGV